MSKKIIRLTESELKNYIRKVISEQVKQPTGDMTTIGRFGSFDAGRLKERGFTVKGGVAILNHPHPKLVVTVKPSQKGWAAYQGGVLKFDLPHDDCDVELDKLIGYNSLQGGYKIGIKEQQEGGFKEGSRDYDHWQDVRIQLIDSGFKNDTNKNLEQYGTSHSLSYGGHNDGVNVLWNKPNNAPYSYIVWVGDNKHKKTFPLGGTNNSSKSVASQVIKYALSLMSLVSKKPMNEGLGLVTGQECYRFGEVYVCVGDKSEYVMNLQKQLNQSNCQKGLPPISLDGVFGPETKERIMINQKSNCKVPGFNTQQYKRIKTPTGEKYVPVQVSGTNLA